MKIVLNDLQLKLGFNTLIILGFCGKIHMMLATYPFSIATLIYWAR